MFDDKMPRHSSMASKLDITLFDIFYILGLVVLTAVFVTAWLSRHIKRTPTWFLFIFSWMFTCITNILLIGKQMGPKPGHFLCLVQSMLLYALPVFCSFTALSYILHMYLSVLAAASGQVGFITRMTNFALLSVPWIFFLASISMVLAMSITDPKIVQRDPSGMYCHVINPLPSRVEAVVIVLVMTVITGLEVLIFLHLRRAWRNAGGVGFLFDRGQGQLASFNAFIRVAIFSILPMLSAGMSTTNFLSDRDNPVRTYSRTNVVVAVIPLTAGLIFGMKKDILRVWVCRPERRPLTFVKEDLEVKSTPV